MFEGTTGQLALLHVGKRTYPDGGKHLDILNANGVDEEEVQRLTSLPEGFSRGNIVAVLELGETTLSTLEERNEPEVVNACCAYGADAGRYQTEIVEAYWLDKPVPMKGQPGLHRKSVCSPRVSPSPSWQRRRSSWIGCRSAGSGGSAACRGPSLRGCG